MKRLTVWILGVVLLLTALVAGAGLWLATTDAGSTRLVRIAEYSLGGALRVGDTGGRIGERFCADTVQFVGASIHVAARQLCVGVDLSRLAFGDVLQFKVVSARQLTIATPQDDAGSDDELFPIEFALPIAVAVPELVVEELVIDEIRITAIKLAGSAIQRSMSIDGAEAVFEDLQVALSGDFSWRGRGLADLGFGVVGEDVDVEGRLRGTPGDLGWNLVARQPVQAVAAGRINLLDEALPYDLEITGWQMDMTKWIGRPVLIGGSLTANGDLTGYRFDYRGRFDDAEYGAIDLHSSGIGDWTSVQGELEGSRGTGEASGSARVSWQPELVFEATLALTGIELANDYTKLNVSGDLAMSGTSTQVSGHVDAMSGVVNDVAFGGAGQFQWSADNLIVDELAISIGDGGLAGRVEVNQGMVDVDLVVSSLGLSNLDLRAAGRVDGRVHATGVWPELVVQGKLAAAEPRFDDYSAQSLNVTMDAAGDRPLQVDVLQVVIADRVFGDIQVDIQGAIESGSARIAWQRDEARLDGRVDFRWADSALRGELAIDALELPDVGVWRGTSVAPFSYRPGAVELSLLCLSRADGARLCGALGYPDGESILQLDGVELDQLALPGGELVASVNIAAEARFTRLFPELEGTARLQLGALEVQLDPDVDPYRLGTIQGSAEISAAGARGRLVSDAGAGITLELEFATEGLQTDAPITGRGRVELQDLALLDPFLPDEVAELGGSFSGEVDLLGRLDAPRWSGKLSWKAGQARIVPVGALLTDVSAEISAADGLTAVIRTGAGMGTVIMEAHADEVGLGAIRRFQASLDLDRAKIMDLPDYQLWMSGAVVAQRRDAILELTGSLTVPEAAIVVNDLPEEAVSSSADVVVVEDEPRDLLGRQMDLKVGFGDSVRVTAFGLDTGVSGQLQLRESPGRLLQVHGVLDLNDGTFAAYGQELVIQRGRMIFNGPLENPTLDVVARRSVESGGDKYDVLLTLTGPARRITTKVSSQPVTTEADALSLLVTGRRLHDSSRTERVNLAAAAKVLGIKSASMLTDRIGGVLGVDEVIVAGDQENLEVGAAMQINPNLYLRYTYDVFSRLGGVLLNYQLTKSLSLHGKSGDSQSIHLNYEIDL